MFASPTSKRYLRTRKMTPKPNQIEPCDCGTKPMTATAPGKKGGTVVVIWCKDLKCFPQRYAEHKTFDGAVMMWNEAREENRKNVRA